MKQCGTNRKFVLGVRVVDVERVEVLYEKQKSNKDERKKGKKIYFDTRHNDYAYMGCNNPTIDFILNRKILQLRCLHESLIEFSIHIPVYMLQSIV